MTKNPKTKRYALIMGIGIIMNLGFYALAHFFHLPMWLDSIGTAYAAVALEPVAGLLIAFVTNFIQSAFIYGTSSIVYYFVGALAALCFGLQSKKLGRAMVSYFFLATLLAGLLTVWRTKGIPDSAWERYFYDLAVGRGFHPYVACFFGTGVLKFGDTIVMGVLVPIFAGLSKRGKLTLSE
ncbi:energy-coupling factor transport system substrate-specific component [Aequitasia blattaphilus]|uniref:ECF transporter S component n=1 Tax=Aequitasia blattaphilus TaxID=2949332 RepID=A0ABT1EAR9_9FIRM|nr:hypothetical protein [Aequitasia blattaphilus]MCP1102714.1 hypothetical protein [Aequitasia blattaphilus]MCR8615354.1 hypothetical protein [Aequitasia blattaphilus]